MRHLHKGWLAALLAVCLLAAGAVRAAFDAPAPPLDLAAWVPEGALLSLETRDFATLLGDWNSSPEEAGWIKSDDYAVFSRSRLFERLHEAQKEFAVAAGVPFDGTVLRQMAGRQTFFAWYDIGELQLVYITRMTPAELSQSQLWQRRKDFATRQAGGVTFYLKGSGAADADSSNAAQDAASDSQASNPNVKKAVAFAETGEWLVLSTSEDLMAQTLDLMEAKGHAGANSLAQQGWYKDARAAAPRAGADLRMVLNMERIVKTPQFRTYWIQQNVTEMKQYRAAVADLYRDADGMREDRVLLPKPETASTADINLGQFAALLPDHVAVYRAMAKPAAADAIAALQVKVLERGVARYEDTSAAPVAVLDTPQAGSVSDLETHIDEPMVEAAETHGSVPMLATVLQRASLDGMMTIDRNSEDGKAEGIWTPFASAVVLSSTDQWDLPAIENAIQQMLQTKLTVGSLGVTWQRKTSQGVNYFATSDAHRVELYVSGHICIVADDPLLLMDIIQKHLQAKSARVQEAMMLSGFDQSEARDSFAQWTRIVDGLSRKEAEPGSHVSAAERADGTAPVFFGEDMKSLSDAFAPMQHEQLIAWHDGMFLRQSITCKWKR